MRRFKAGCVQLGSLWVMALLLAAPQPGLADCGPARLEEAILERVTPEGDLVLADTRRLRLAGLHLDPTSPGGANTLAWPKAGDRLGIGLLETDKDRWSRLPAIVFAMPVGERPIWLQQRLLEGGAALARPEPDLGACWPLLIQAEAKAQGKLPDMLVEPGRFTRISGKVSRVGDGRSAHFITVFGVTGERSTGLVQKRHLKRFSEAGVDVAQLRGQFIRMRGVRSTTNASIIPLTSPDQIEIVR